MAGKRFSESARPASVMVLVLFTIVLLLLSGAGVLSIGQTARIFSIRTSADVAARSAADTGITKAVWAINAKLQELQKTGGTWNKQYQESESQTELPNSDARYTFFTCPANWLYGNIMPSGNEDLIDFLRSASWKDGDYVIRSRGDCGTARKIIYAIVALKGPGDTGVLVLDKLILKASTLVAGADSRNGPELDPDVLVEIGTVSTGSNKIILYNGVEIRGNVAVGVGGIVDTVIEDHTTNGNGVTGLKYSLPEKPELPYIYPPEEELGIFEYHDTEISRKTFSYDSHDSNDLNYPNENRFYLDESHNGRYTSIDLKSDVKTDKLIIKSGNNVVLHLTNTGGGTPNASIYMTGDCEIIIEKGATLNLYVDGDISSGNESGFNNLGTPPSLKIWGYWREPLGGHNAAIGGHQDWQLNAKSAYFGQIYAPHAHMVVQAKGDLFGAFTARSFDMRNGGALIYDSALRDVKFDDEGIRFVLKRWYER